MNKWISVKDRPVPSDSKTYLIYRVIENCGFCELRKGDLVYGNVTHWMPLPEPPEGGNRCQDRDGSGQGGQGDRRKAKDSDWSGDKRAVPGWHRGGRTVSEIEIYKEALRQWGPDAQTLMVFEEMSELQKELCKAARGKDNQREIAEEIADVYIMLGQMILLHKCAEEVEEAKAMKLERLRGRIREAGDSDGGKEFYSMEGSYRKLEDSEQ